MKNAIIRVLARLLRSTTGNGEIVGALILVGVAVTAGYLGIKAIGGASQSTAQGQASTIQALPK